MESMTDMAPKNKFTREEMVAAEVQVVRKNGAAALTAKSLTECMGLLGEMYVFYMRLLPQSYRIVRSPSTTYDGMIFVANATPTHILPSDAGE